MTSAQAIGVMTRYSAMALGFSVRFTLPTMISAIAQRLGKEGHIGKFINDHNSVYRFVQDMNDR